MFWSLTPDFTLVLFQDPEDGVEGFVGFLCPSYQMGQIEYISFLFYFFYQYDSFNQFIDYGCIDLAWAQVINAKFGNRRTVKVRWVDVCIWVPAQVLFWQYDLIGMIKKTYFRSRTDKRLVK